MNKELIRYISGTGRDMCAAVVLVLLSFVLSWTNNDWAGGCCRVEEGDERDAMEYGHVKGRWYTSRYVAEDGATGTVLNKIAVEGVQRVRGPFCIWLSARHGCFSFPFSVR